MSRDWIRFTGIRKHFPVRGGILKREVSRINVLNGIDLEIEKGETFGIIGESGCGKSTLAKLMMKLEKPSSGSIYFAGDDIGQLSGDSLKRYYDRVQMIFQDPFSSLNPRLRVRSIIGEMLLIRGVPRSEIEGKVLEVLEDVGLSADSMGKYPHEFSGGQRQRIAIARALVVHPEVLIADEPVSALDLSFQARTLKLIGNLKEKYGLTVALISHDLHTVADFCDRAAVIYAGRVVELLSAGDLICGSEHPYTKALVSSIPARDPLKRGSGEVLMGEVPDPANIPGGCPFHPRCVHRMEICESTRPELIKKQGKEHWAACHLQNKS